MNSRERVMTAMRHNEPDRVPFDFPNGFAPAVLEDFHRRTAEPDPYDYFDADVRYVGPWGPSTQPIDHARYHKNLPPRAWIDEWGVGHQPTESIQHGHSHLEGFLYPMLDLHTAQDILDYPLPDLEAPARTSHIPAELAAYHARGRAVVACSACTLFEQAWYMRSMELLLMDFVDNPEFAEILLDRLTEKRISSCSQMAAMGVDILQLGDDVASQRGMIMSVPMWRRWFKPRMARIIDASRKANPELLVFYHSDGNCTAIIPDLIEIGIDILNPVQSECMDGPAIKKEFGKDLSFWGTIGTQTTLPFGTPDDVRSEVKTRFETMGKGGGLCLAPTHMVEPDVSWENLVAFVEAVKQFGRYS